MRKHVSEMYVITKLLLFQWLPYSIILGDAYRSMSFDFIMWVFSEVTFHGPNVKSCLLLLNPWDIMADRLASRL